MHRIAGSIEVNTITMDSQNMLWFKSENGLYNLEIGDQNPTLVKLPDGTPSDLHSASMAGDNVVMFSEEGDTRVTIDPMAQQSLLRSLSLFGRLDFGHDICRLFRIWRICLASKARRASSCDSSRFDGLARGIWSLPQSESAFT
ncbi:MAG: hypothetical protein Ct9H90mP16_01450 [Candidatus Poseidoniales archaeon]|nr:MAG: hypothetical protein Ct9H90mP16_01450 [Candidatus Poseidoniales archaeon]